jgi:competence protein ComEC
MLLAGAFLAGVLASRLFAGPWLALTLIGPLVLIFLVQSGRRPRLTLVGLVIVAALGYLRGQSVVSSASPDLFLAYRQGEPVTLEVRVSDRPRMLPGYSRARLELLPSGSGRVEAWLPSVPSVVRGYVLTVSGSFTSTGGYGASPGKTVLSVRRLRVDRSDSARFERLFTRLDRFATDAIERHVPYPAGPLVLGVMYGNDDGMTGAERDAFRRAGLSHITAVSGWNLSLIAVAAGALLRGRAMTSVRVLLVLLLSIWAYATLVGLEPSVMRAATMTTLVLLARARGRPGDGLTALLLSAAAIVGLSPSVLSEISFQLSFTATLALVLVADLGVGSRGWMALLMTGIAVEIAVMPLVLHQFGMYALLAPVTNILVDGLVFWIMAGGVATLIGAAFSPVLADAVGAVTWFPARAVMFVAERTSDITWASGLTTSLSAGWAVVWFLALALVYALLWMALEPRRLAALDQPERIVPV